VRYPKGALPSDVPALVTTDDGIDVLHQGGARDVLLIAAGPMASVGLAAAEEAARHGISVTVVDPRWVLPVTPALATMAAGYDAVVTVEDNARSGGFGWAVNQALREFGVEKPLCCLGIPPAFLEQGSRSQVLQRCGLTAEAVAQKIVELPKRGVAHTLNGTSSTATVRTITVPDLTTLDPS
jgi:1-deoxy-D-xylulose-5-phosphate synthase